MCTCVGVISQSSATHTSRTDKTCVELMWIAPSSGTGCIRFRLAISRLTVVRCAAKKLQSERPIKRRTATAVSYLRVGTVLQY